MILILLSALTSSARALWTLTRNPSGHIKEMKNQQQMKTLKESQNNSELRHEYL